MRQITSVALLAFSVAGCASFSADDLPTFPPLEDSPQMPAVSYELRTFGSTLLGMSGSVESRIEPLFRRAFREIRAPGEVETDLHIDLLLRQTTRHPALSFGLGLMFVSSVGLFPAYGCDELYLDVRVQREGQTLKQYLYTDDLDTWYHLFLLPWSFQHDPENVGARILDSLTRQFLEDLRRDLPTIEG